MKILKKVLPLLLILCVFLSFPVIAYADHYTYTVRIYAGNQGTVDGGSVRTISGLPIGDYDFSVHTFSVNADVSDKYFVKGLRESGRDNHDRIYTNSVPVSHDVDYVVSYGIYGSEVSFTLICVDANTGRELARETHYGNLGDEIYIKSLYIDRYRPQASYVHRTLELKAEERTLLYYPITTTTTTGGGGGGGTTITTPTEPTTDDQGQQGQTGTEGGTEGGTIGADEGYIPGANIPGVQEYPPTEDILDMDVPQAAPDSDASSAQPVPPQHNARVLPKWALILGAVALFGLIGLLFWYLLFYRKKKRRDEEDEDDYDFDYDDYE